MGKTCAAKIKYQENTMSKTEIEKSAYGNGDTSWFVKDRFGMFIHWGLYALPARNEWVKYHEKMTTEEYQKYFENFNPDLFDPEKWAKTAKAAGMKYFVITTKHHEGFCLFESIHTDYKASNTPYGKDIIRMLVDAFRKEGFKVGFYYSLIDWHHPEFPIDRIHPQNMDEEYKKTQKTRDIKKYAEYMRKQVTELLTNYGKIDILWFDYSYPDKTERGPGKGREDWESEKLIKLVRKLQPHVIVDRRLDLPRAGDFATPEQYVPEEGLKDENGHPTIWEGCQTFSGSWCYFRDELTWKSTSSLIQMLINHISRGGNLLLNVGPTGRGEFDYRALNALKYIGDWMRVHSRAIYECGAPPEDLIPPSDCRYTYNSECNILYLHLFTWPQKYLNLPGLADKIKYAQLLNDASEIKFSIVKSSHDMASKTPEGAITLDIPAVTPLVEIPVIEIFLKDK
jgi:alpha-L-fucosidase